MAHIRSSGGTCTIWTWLVGRPRQRMVGHSLQRPPRPCNLFVPYFQLFISQLITNHLYVNIYLQNCIWLAPTVSFFLSFLRRQTEKKKSSEGCVNYIFFSSLQMMTFSNCRNVILKSLRFRNSAQSHILVMGSQNVHIKDVKIKSPEISPNTDGVHITSSSDVSITHSDFATGKFIQL